jgi:hypothetical protein
MTVHNRRCDCCGDRRPLVPSEIHPGEQYIAGVASAWALLPPLLNGLEHATWPGRATPRPCIPHGITPTGRPSATGPPTLGPGRDTPPPLPLLPPAPSAALCDRGVRPGYRCSPPAWQRAPRAAGGPSHLDHRPRHTERVTQGAAHTAQQRTRPNPEKHMPDPGGYRDKRPPAKSKTSSAARGLGCEHRRNRERMHPNHIDGPPCPCGIGADCGPGCLCRRAGYALPMYRKPGPQPRRPAAHGGPLDRSQSRWPEGRPTRARRLQPLPRCW